MRTIAVSSSPRNAIAATACFPVRRRGLGAAEFAGLGAPVGGVDARDLVGVAARQAVEAVDHRAREFGVVDGSSLGSGVEDDHVDVVVAAERGIGEATGLGRFRGGVEHAARTQVVRQPVTVARERQRRRGDHADHQVPGTADEPSPPLHTADVLSPGGPATSHPARR
ncbi:hypothetical protein [Nocardia farcinica]